MQVTSKAITEVRNKAKGIVIIKLTCDGPAVKRRNTQLLETVSTFGDMLSTVAWFA